MFGFRRHTAARLLAENPVYEARALEEVRQVLHLGWRWDLEMGWNGDEKCKDQKAKLFQAMLSYGHLWATCGYYAYHQDSHDSILRCIPVGFSIFSFLYRLDTQILSVNSSQKFKVKIPFPFSKSMETTNNVKHPTAIQEWPYGTIGGWCS